VSLFTNCVCVLKLMLQAWRLKNNVLCETSLNLLYFHAWRVKNNVMYLRFDHFTFTTLSHHLNILPLPLWGFLNGANGS